MFVMLMLMAMIRRVGVIMRVIVIVPAVGPMHMLR